MRHWPLAVYIHSPGHRGVIAQVKTGKRGGFHVYVKRSKLQWYYSRNHGRVDLDLVARGPHGQPWAHAIKFWKSRRLVRVHFMKLRHIP